MITEPLPDTREDWRAVVVFVLSNWRDELLALFRESSNIGAAGDPAILEFRGDTVVLYAAQDGEAPSFISELGFDRVAGEIDASPDGGPSLPTKLAGLIHEHNLAANVTVRIPDQDILRPVVRMPALSRHNLSRALVYELERISPVPVKELYFDFRPGKERQRGSPVDVALRITRRLVVDRALDICAMAGLSVARIQLGTDSIAAHGVNFPRLQTFDFGTLWRRWSLAILASGAFLLLIASLLAGYARGSAALDALSDQLTNDGLEAAQVAKIEKEVETTSAQLDFLAREKRAPLMVDILSELTRALPDGTWITQLSIEGNSVRLVGYSSSAAALVPLLDRSARFANARFASPVTHNPNQNGTNVERFDISANLVGGGL